MLNKNSSAGTAAQKISKCSLLAGLPLLLAILLLCAVSGQAQRKLDTVRVLILYSDTTYKGISPTQSTFVLSVREKHNTGEGVMDSGAAACVDSHGRIVPCYNDYWKHLYYLTENKKPINKNWVVWESVP
jgi:hypothetical protein